MAVRGIIVAENRQVADDFEARAIHGYQNHRLLLVDGSRWIRPSLCVYELCVVRVVLYVRARAWYHEDHNFTTGVSCTRSPPLPAIDDVFVAVPLNAGLNVCGIGGSLRECA